VKRGTRGTRCRGNWGESIPKSNIRWVKYQVHDILLEQEKTPHRRMGERRGDEGSLGSWTALV
jgi:hypothetical protein